ncbi:MAG: mechanosensitive ion channel family protein [Metallibacterium scheffleri]|jgi:small-conductance mechanosensitive channel|uniref:mechanosensitive ion channel family protein n=1 Tax=Metallibacterium scheffleri TaxID=993689 RepID=UPI0026ED6A67|nr:mechanosensitive ion channel domain-containing protein [Metallibacterium scheffleri]MCK9367671.1 mechanosensitive ion channel family protein [Metallibacterium scheffleri]
MSLHGSGYATVVVILAATLVAAFTINRLFSWLLRRAAVRSASAAFSLGLMPALEPLLFLVGVALAIERVPQSAHVLELMRHVWLVLLIVDLTWLAWRALGGVEDIVRMRYPATAPDNLNDRRVLTQMRVLVGSARVLVTLVGGGIALMSFPMVRAFGASLLASAGIAGIVVGFAARPVLSNLLAGLQLALTQPLRIDDVVIVQGHWGRIEEIRGTYVVVRIWNERRLIVPLQWFIENPFENWTRSSAELIEVVHLWVDYRTPLQPLRDELQRVCRASPDWDGRVAGLQVTEASAQALQLRVLASAADSSRGWNLSCAVREELVDFMQRHYPECLPRWRGELATTVAGAGAGEDRG